MASLKTTVYYIIFIIVVLAIMGALMYLSITYLMSVGVKIIVCGLILLLGFGVMWAVIFEANRDYDSEDPHGDNENDFPEFNSKH
jgi:hypothetical protein